MFGHVWTLSPYTHWLCGATQMAAATQLRSSCKASWTERGVSPLPAVGLLFTADGYRRYRYLFTPWWTVAVRVLKTGFCLLTLGCEAVCRLFSFRRGKKILSGGCISVGRAKSPSYLLSTCCRPAALLLPPILMEHHFDLLPGEPWAAHFRCGIDRRKPDSLTGHIADIYADIEGSFLHHVWSLVFLLVAPWRVLKVGGASVSFSLFM